MSAEIGFGIVGAGMVARYHARAIAETPGARLAAICRADASRADEAAAELGVPCEASLEALLERPDVDAVCLCTPSGLHAEQALAAARAGKHVLVEKPMALRLADADAMIAACRDAGVRLGVALQRRTDPASRALHDAIRAGELGSLVLGTATVPYFRPQSYYDSAAWRGTWSLDGGGALMNQGIHLVDLLLWLMGGEAEVVGASGGVAQHEIEVEDCVVAALRFSVRRSRHDRRHHRGRAGVPAPRRGLWQPGRGADRGGRAGPLGRRRAPDPPPGARARWPRDRGPAPPASAPSGTRSSCRISSPRSARVAIRWWTESRAAAPWRWFSPSTRPPASAAGNRGARAERVTSTCQLC